MDGPQQNPLPPPEPGQPFQVPTYYNYPPPPKKKSPVIPIFIATVVIVAIVILAAVSLFQTGEKPEYQRYETFTTTADGYITTLYKNDNLNVSIIFRVQTGGNGSWAGDMYYAYQGEDLLHYRDNPDDLYNSILSRHGSRLTAEQLKWFEYMCKEIL